MDEVHAFFPVSGKLGTGPIADFLGYITKVPAAGLFDFLKRSQCFLIKT
jgi:hypothetical protein